jgi:hypothetical protein
MMINACLRRAGVIAFACLMPVAAAAQSVSVDYDRGVDFTKYRSYAWAPVKTVENPLIDRRIVAAIEGELAKKGWTKDSTSAGAVVLYQAAIDESRQLVGWSTGPRWSGMGTIREEKVLTGQMVVEIYDAATQQLIWRGIVSDAISDKPETNEKRLNAAVAKLFKKFPPSVDVRTGTR